MAAPDELFCWEGAWGLPSVSSDCLTAYAQFAGAPLKLRKISNPWRSPSGSLPALRTNQKETLSRPSDIIIHLRKQKFTQTTTCLPERARTAWPSSLCWRAAQAGSVRETPLLGFKELQIPHIYNSWVDSKNYVE
ncbi:Metaxin-1 [Dissostichus eleginoides]|uniref:Metaxin-1 n=1 Tax=Dissostichus eleginoides TaxID=100907 RepID=A0AAD9C522_DISEL|nr:Metaxin-1 [Dissostichus eleginoides]